jgi:N-carbamoylputrescine amidase
MKVGVIQLSYSGDKATMRAKTTKKIQEAKERGAQLVLLQELHETQYFCQSENVENFDLAGDFEKTKAFWAAVAKEFEVVLVTSLFEKRAVGVYHNTAVVFESDGSVAGMYRKMHIPDDPGFYEKFYFAPGDLGFEPIQTSVGLLGVLVCWDQWYPEAARLMALKGAEILIYPTAIGWFDTDSKEEKARQLDAWITVQRGHAIANALPLVSINRSGFERDDSGVLEGIHFWGNSFVLGAQGEYLARCDEEESLLVMDIDMQKAESIRRIWPFMRDRRIESYSGLLERFID